MSRCKECGGNYNPHDVPKDIGVCSKCFTMLAEASLHEKSSQDEASSECNQTDESRVVNRQGIIKRRIWFLVRAAVLLFVAWIFITKVIPDLGRSGLVERRSHQRLSRTGDLTRELAKQILREHLSRKPKKPVSILNFTPKGIERAKNDGVMRWIDQGARPIVGGRYGYYEFTEKGLRMFEGFDLADKPLSRGTDEYSGRVMLRLNSPIPVTLDRITGITEGWTSNVRAVEYTTDYAFPESATVFQLTKYLYSGTSESATFRQYDDGWRIVER